MTPQNPTIELLDGKYAFVNDAQDEVFLLELERFLNFLLTDERFKDYAQLISQEWVQRHAEYQRKLAEEKDRLIELKGRFVERYPELDDSNMPKPNALPEISIEAGERYKHSFARFDEVARDDWKPESFTLNLGKYHDDSSVRRLLRILGDKISNAARQNHPEKDLQEINDKFLEIKTQHRYNHRGFVNAERVYTGASLSRLKEIVQEINPEHRNHDSTMSKETFEKEIIWGDIELNIYEGDSFLKRPPDEEETRRFQKRIEICKRDLQRVYEELRACIGTHLSHLQLVHRYKQRCMWYDRERVRTLVMKDGKLVNRPEGPLTLDLARYLFDNGVTALYRPLYGHHEFDLLALSSSLLVEAKAYKNSSKTRNYLKNGVYQIHAYLNNLSSKYFIDEAHYVIFRLGGPLYIIEPKIVINPFILYTTVIDIGESSDSGSKQPRPITIPTDEIIEGLEA